MRYRVREIANWANGSTLLGLLAAGLGGATLRRGPNGLLLAHGYQLAIPPRRSRAFTVGNVVLCRLSDTELAEHPTLLTHEARHATQYAWCVGLLMLPMYFVAAGWSWVRTGDYASRNVFERLAGLADGGYVERPSRVAQRRAAQREAAAAAGRADR
ncbi:MAG: hypothetical protein L0Y54_08235 [Sporichthyaceae bacterium]|nr:hypothetical protein [Sporichthyaceae bacterium]